MPRLIALLVGIGWLAGQTTGVMADPLQPDEVFLPPVPYQTATEQHLIRLGDMNNDGNDDLVTIDRTAEEVSVWLGSPDGTFSFQTTVSAAGRPKALTCADFNNDDNLDVAASLEVIDKTQLFLGDGVGNIAPLAAFSSVSNINSVEHGDFNEDGIVDLVIAGSGGGRACFFLGAGNGTLTTGNCYPVGQSISTENFVVHDFNFDNHLDVAVCDTNGGAVYVLIGDGAGNFVVGEAIEPSCLTFLGGLHAGYLNDDPYLDFVSMNNNGRGYAVFLADPENPVDFFVSDYCGLDGWHSPAIACIDDFDGDGINDIAVPDYGMDEVIMLKGVGDGTFTELDTRYPIQEANNCKSGDFDHDGRADLAVGSYIGGGGQTWILLSPQPVLVTVSGTLSADCTGPLSNVTVDLADGGEGFYTGLTNDDGEYLFEDIPFSADVDAAEVSVSVPLGVQAVEPESGAALLTLDQSQTQDFTFACLDATGVARSMGYWKHQARVYLRGRGHAQELQEDVETNYPLSIFEHFFNADLASIRVPGVTYIGTEADPMPIDLETIATTLTVNRGGTMEDRAKQQYLAFLLNVASGKLLTYTVVADDGATASQALQQVADFIRDGDPSNDETAKDIADTINNASLVAAGVIDDTYDTIPYREGVGTLEVPSITALVDITPSPFRSQAVVRFVLAETSEVAVRVYSVGGRLVRELADERLASGRHQVVWDGRDTAGRAVPASVYYVELEADGNRMTKRVVLMR